MSLKNYQMNTILREYDSRRLQNSFELDCRKKEVYDKIPSLAAIDEELVHASVSAAKLSLYGNTAALNSLKKNNQKLIEKKEALLMSHGYSTDYLNLRYSCPLCKDTGFVGNEKCTCFKQAIVNLLYSQSNVQAAIAKENFDTFSFDYYSDEEPDSSLHLTPRENIKRVVDCIHSFIINFDKKYENILLYGNTGVGKTFLSNCIAKELLDRSHTVIYLTSFQFFDILEKYKFNTASQDENIRTQFEYIFDCDLLIIDDIGTEMNNTFITSQFYQCINERHLKQKSTVISTNLSFEQLKNNYSERIFSRISSNYLLLKLIGEDIRIKKLLGAGFKR